MKHYKDPAGNIYGLTLEQVAEGFAARLPPGCREVSDEDVAAAVESLRVAAITPESVRADRDALLARCDWTQIPDADLTAAQRAAWKTYRKALRDITDAPGFPNAVEWPSAPV